MELDFDKTNGLVPAIIQDNETRKVLMLGFMNKEAYDKTVMLIELALYLDTHKEDAEAFGLFQQYVALEKAGREKYEAMYGPVTHSATADGKSWSAWISDPWPWDYPEGGKK